VIKVFVVDDSAFIRKALVKVLGGDPRIRLVGEAANGVEALARVPATDPDLVTLDVAMPGADGLAVLRGLLRWKPALRVLMLSAHTREGAASTLEALNAGAVDFVDKTSFNLMDLERLKAELLERILVWAPANGGRPRDLRRWDPRADPPPVAVVPGGAGLELCLIGASTGGPAALQYILERLPGSFPLPIVVVQHMPAGFTGPFAERLNGLSRLRVSEAVEGEALEPGRVLIAPGGRHLRISRRRRVALSEEPGDARHVPSVDVAIHSALQASTGPMLGVLLTGMGEDGAEGLGLIRAGGGVTLAESQSTCAVYGMPRAAYERGAVTHLLPLPAISDWLGRLSQSV
jgi:two-component system chemotaxis response regulator CheB